jgi:hypothetical protein
MRDVVFLAVIVGFFTLAALYVRWADRLVGPDEETAATGDPDVEPVAVSEEVTR